MKARTMKDLHCSWYLKILASCTRPKTPAIWREFSNVIRSVNLSLHSHTYDFLYLFAGNEISHFRVRSSLYFKASLSVKSLKWKWVSTHMESRTNYHHKTFALRLALNKRLERTRKWPIKLESNRFFLNLSSKYICIACASDTIRFYGVTTAYSRIECSSMTQVALTESNLAFKTHLISLVIRSSFVRKYFQALGVKHPGVLID